MLSIDTNVLVRLLTNDDPAQATLVAKTLDQAVSQAQQVWVSDIVMCELVWVLQGAYGYNKAQIIDTLNALLQFTAISFQSPALLHTAVSKLSSTNADFADTVIGLVSQQAGAKHVLTFDKKAAKLETHQLLK